MAGPSEKDTRASGRCTSCAELSVRSNFWRKWCSPRGKGHHTEARGVSAQLSQAGNSGIYDYIRQNSDKTVTMDDVRRTISDDDAVEETAVNFYLKNQKVVSIVVRIARGESGEHR
ncbi:hypothetical protein L917_20653 [Phytophthora nicotianae]|uniref:Uncharacterized protein n=1 Tax=Phytophthora nicotianae TaxID=4792 RepID=W2K055_PHYNI|nr:hypothetical protein L917_20653 [Phytophthora nicotianae]